MHSDESWGLPLEAVQDVVDRIVWEFTNTKLTPLADEIAYTVAQGIIRALTEMGIAEILPDLIAKRVAEQVKFMVP